MKNPRRRANDDHDKQQPSETKRLLLAIVFGTMFGYLIGASSFPGLSTTRVIPAPTLQLNVNGSVNVNSTTETRDKTPNQTAAMDPRKIWAPSNPRGAELLPPKLVVSESDFFPRRLWGLPSEDLPFRPKYLVTFTVGYNQKNNIDAAVKKFSENFTILLFHYDGRTTEWNEFEWSKRAIHVSVPKQTKWWFAKRFLHPDIVAAYEYIFMWDEDLGVENFNAEEYIKLVKKHGLEISQPALEPKEGYWINWEMTKRKSGHEVHKVTEEKPGWCSDPLLPPCAGFVEIMAPVFSRNSWRCVWYMIQNDLVHGWGLDLALQICVESPAHEKIGVVDAQPVFHQMRTTLGDGGKSENGKPSWKTVNERCHAEWAMFRTRLENAEKEYNKSIGIKSSDPTSH